MPQTTPYLASQWPGMDNEAVGHLQSRGYILQRDWSWDGGSVEKAEVKDVSAVTYLIEEWDFDGMDILPPNWDEMCYAFDRERQNNELSVAKPHVTKERYDFLIREMEELATRLQNCDSSEEDYNYILENFGHFYKDTLRAIGSEMQRKIRQSKKLLEEGDK